jgi:hypothetical protein
MSSKPPKHEDVEARNEQDPAAELERAERDLAELAAEVSELAGQEERAGELQRRAFSSPEQAAQARSEIERIRGELAVRQEHMQRAERRANRALERQQQEVRDMIARQRAAVERALAPVRKMAARLEEGLETMSLYLGRGEQIITVRDGTPAGELEPIVLRQMVLAMDEESGLFAETEGMTVEDVDAFDEWLCADSAHVDQIVPDRKSVVAMVARWTRRRERDLARDPEDQLTHFIIRNGDAVYRSSVQFAAGDVLIPKADEFVRYFYTERWNPETHEDERVALKPGSEAYEQAMERSDARGRHYLRIGLILQGLVDRTEIFHPLHPAGVNMLSDPAKRSDRVRIITDAEGGLESGLQSFRDWQAEVNADLRPGVRVVGAFDSSGFRNSFDEDDASTRRIHPRTAEKPPSGVPLLIEDRTEQGGLVIRYERTEEIWDPDQWEENPDRPGWGWRGGRRKPKRRASCVIYPSDRFVLPYDLVDAAALQRFLSERRNRREYKDLWPLLRQVMFAKRAEEAEEAPFRMMLAGVLARENEVTVAEAEADIPDLVRWFKLANRWHRPLVFTSGTKPGKPVKGEDAESEAHAVRLICAEHRRRVKDRNRVVRDDVVKTLAATHPDYLVIARPRRGGYLVLTACDERDVYVNVHRYTAAGSAQDSEQWQLVGARSERWTEIRHSERWENWDRLAAAHEHITGPERDALCDQIKRKVSEQDGQLLAITQAEKDGPFHVWVIEHGCRFDPQRALTGRLEEPELSIREATWRRKGRGPVSLSLGRWGSSFSAGRDGTNPLDHRWAGARAALVLFLSEEALAEWREQSAHHRDAELFRGPLEELLARAEASVQSAWLEQELARERARFLRGRRAEDWPAAAEKLQLSFPHGRRRSSFITRLDAKPAWIRALQVTLQNGIAVDQVTVGEMFAHAVSAGLRGGQVPVEGRANVTEWSDEAVPELETDLSELTISLAAPSEPETGEAEPDADAELDEDDEASEKDAAALSDELLERMADSLRPDRSREDEVLLEREDGDVLGPE